MLENWEYTIISHTEIPVYEFLYGISICRVHFNWFQFTLIVFQYLEGSSKNIYMTNMLQDTNQGSVCQLYLISAQYSMYVRGLDSEWASENAFLWHGFRIYICRHFVKMWRYSTFIWLKFVIKIRIQSNFKLIRGDIRSMFYSGDYSFEEIIFD